MISGFDYQNGLYYYNVGEGMHRSWDDYREFGFISAGQKAIFRDAILGFEVGDIFAAYFKGKGFVGIGKITQKAKPVREVLINNTLLLNLPLRCINISENSDNMDTSEYVALVEWIVEVDKSEAKWKSNSGIFTSQLVRASLDAQPYTVKYLEKEFDVNFKNLLI